MRENGTLIHWRRSRLTFVQPSGRSIAPTNRASSSAKVLVAGAFSTRAATPLSAAEPQAPSRREPEPPGCIPGEGIRGGGTRGQSGDERRNQTGINAAVDGDNHRESSESDRRRHYLDLLRCHHNYCRPHGALRFGDAVRTPAMQAGLVPRKRSFQRIPPTSAAASQFASARTRREDYRECGEDAR